MKIMSNFSTTLVVVMLLTCGGCQSREDAKKTFDEADALWDRGEKANAIDKYKAVYGSRWTTKSEKEEKILPRIVEFEMRAGKTEEAKTWMKRGLENGLKVEYTEAAAKELFAAALKEHEAAAEEARRKKAEDEVTRLSVKDGGLVPVAISQRAADRLTQLSVANDKTGVSQMVSAGSVWTVPSGTKCLMIDLGFSTSEVRILEGPYAGRACFVATDFVVGKRF